MDYREWPLWMDAAKARYAKQEMSMATACAYPHMEELYRDQYMQNLVNQINGREIREIEAQLNPTPEMEAEWARNRAWLAGEYGRIE